MIDTLFGGITAIATTVGGLAAMYTAWATYKSNFSNLTVTGRSYDPKADTDSAQISILVSAKKQTYVKSISCKGRTLSLTLNGEKAPSVLYGISFGPKGRHDFPEELFIAPAPKKGEPIVLVFDTGNRWVKPTFELWPSDFTVDGYPDQGEWPTHR